MDRDDFKNDLLNIAFFSDDDLSELINKIEIKNFKPSCRVYYKFDQLPYSKLYVLRLAYLQDVSNSKVMDFLEKNKFIQLKNKNINQIKTDLLAGIWRTIN